MNYSGLIRQFWQHNEKEPLGAVAASIYLFLLEIWKKNEENDFKLSDTEICERLKITRPTIITLRQKLSNLGMIQYQSKNGLPGHYKILREYAPTLSAFEKPETDKGGSTTKRSQKPIPKKKETTEKLPQKRETPQNQNLSPDAPPEIPVAIPIPGSGTIPSLDEFTEYAKTLESYVPELDHLIKEKYESWLGNEWKNGYNKPITNWKSSIKNTMPFLQTELESQNSAPQNKIALQSIKRPKSTFDESKK
ncbi:MULTISPECIES: hypothetical protein [Empedobacter]|uniref:hypothetical protein n=1 Tax=Empedobacter TaxID=59734 RepID=UPI001C5A2242|nr:MULTISPECIES: hypothetical protein [Empedobacter]MBW1619041.1 hypothetical protein [Empedobacter falsenii]MDM1040231.1 hypothetical protein [Empedobacter brevis]MDM1134163.1 hypothetical protein [Empedobacter sp. R750]